MTKCLYVFMRLSEYGGEKLDGPLFYRRYMDDVFAVFMNQDQAARFLTFLNGKHPNIKFTMEMSDRGVLNFLDVKVDNNDLFRTSVYHKPTFTGLMTNFRSFVPADYKKRLVLTLMDRTFKINNIGNLPKYQTYQSNSVWNKTG